jgi:3-oxoacyl-(acyl-carrier-protein) synthase
VIEPDSVKRRRVVVTGVGLVSCLGHDYGQVVNALRNGVSGTRHARMGKFGTEEPSRRRDS